MSAAIDNILAVATGLVVVAGGKWTTYRIMAKDAIDEATSAIDVETEASIFESLAATRPELTIIVVAHRASTLAMCDRIIRLEDGRIIEDSRVEAPGRWQGEALPVVTRDVPSASAGDRP